MGDLLANGIVGWRRNSWALVAGGGSNRHQLLYPYAETAAPIHRRHEGRSAHHFDKPDQLVGRDAASPLKPSNPQCATRAYRPDPRDHALDWNVRCANPKRYRPVRRVDFSR